MITPNGMGYHLGYHPSGPYGHYMPHLPYGPVYVAQPFAVVHYPQPVVPHQQIQASPQESKSPEDLKRSIKSFVDCLENSPDHTQAITLLSNRFAIKRRRLYDVINVLESVGACKKSGLDIVKWLGLSHMKASLKRLREERHIDDVKKSLNELFLPPCCVGISNLTTSFLLLFAAIKSNRLDLRFVSQFFSRSATRYKTTLCKLYQICYILGAIGVTTRTSQVCEVILSDEYCDADFEKYGESRNNVSKTERAMSIASLLNNQSPTAPEWILSRRKELQSCSIDNVTDIQGFEIDCD